MPDEPTLDLVLKRNSIERLKREKFPLDIVDELPEIIERGYENISEEDVVRFMWYGLYHDKPKVGYFMMRIKIPSGLMTPHQFRTIGDLSQTYGRNEGELSTRQNVQLHWIKLDYLPEIFATLEAAGLTTLGGCGDTVRNITGCPVAGIDRDELFDATGLVTEAARFFYGHRVYSDLPRKHKITISTCAHQCNAPEINCIALVGTFKDGRPGYAVRVGGGLSTVPRISKHLGVFVPEDEAMDVLRAILDAWRTNLKYRLSRVKARLKFMVDDFGAEGMRSEVERVLGRQLEDLPEPPGRVGGLTEHIGINPQQQAGLSYVGFPVRLGRISGEQMVRVAEIAESVGGDVRLTRQQNFIVANVPEAEVDRVVGEVGGLGFPLDVSKLHGTSLGCTGSPLCNYAVAETKVKLDEILVHLEAEFGRAADGIVVNVDGCPHACAQHWVADIGLQGSTLRERGDAGEKLEAYEIYLRGGLGDDAAIGRPLVRRVPEAEAKEHVSRLIHAYLERRGAPSETFKTFADRHSDEELVSIATDRPLEEVLAAAAARHKGADRVADDPNA
ncbi:MAG TPA: nitrite/sulfite reductase [Chloroflexota bacterium]|jgi:ferredoxin-nitrite reductase|nr:nitrite/sulfite reductase [Chloroflexota bacterium]